MLDLSEHVVVQGEDPKQFEALRAALTTEFDPQLAEERELVTHAAGLIWRLRRASAFEKAVIEAHRAEQRQTDSEYKRRYDEAFDQARDEFGCFDMMKRALAQRKKPIDAVPPGAEVIEPAPQMHEPPREKEPLKFDMSFVGEPSFLDALSKSDRNETQLTEELSRTLRLLPRNRTAPKRMANSRTYKPTSCDLIPVRAEDAGQFERMSLEFERQYHPQTAVERELVERLVGLSWRLHRVPTLEASLMKEAHAAFQPVVNSRSQWPPIEWLYTLWTGMTATEREAEAKKVSAKREAIDKRTLEILGDEAQEDDAHLWYLRQPDLQDKLAKLARHQRALTRQLDCTRRLLLFLQTAAENSDPKVGRSKRGLPRSNP